MSVHPLCPVQNRGRQRATLRGLDSSTGLLASGIISRTRKRLAGCFHHRHNVQRSHAQAKCSSFWQERARQWRIFGLTSRRLCGHGADLMARVAMPQTGLVSLTARWKSNLQSSVAVFGRFNIGFDPVNEPPPSDLPDQCDCGTNNKRGRKACSHCKTPLRILSRYKVWYDALTLVHTSECYGISLGARSADLLKWLPALRPYRGRENDTNGDFFDCVYAVTHLVYSLNHYMRSRLSPRSLLRICLS